MIVTLDEAAQWAADARAARRSVVLANGAFDLFHVGHLRYLEAAKALADLLVVAVNSDSSVRAAKGEGRPVVPELERAEIVAGLRCVDRVLIFSEPDVRRVVRAIRPNVHAKGTDYTAESVPERDVVIECGGRVVIAGDPKAHSTSAILKSVAQRR